MMKKAFGWTIILLLVMQYAGAQYDRVWTFGNRAGLDFNTTIPTRITTGMNTREGCASVSDAAGSLLFYTDGARVWNRTHQLMPGSTTSIVPIGSAPTASTAQGALIVPVPEHPDLYYVFSLTSLELGANAGRLYYSLVDMRLDNGLGDIVTSEKGIFLDSGLTEHMTAVGGDMCNIWVLVADRNNVLKAYSIDSGGISAAPVTSPMLNIAPAVHTVGFFDVSPDKQKLAVSRSHVELYDFDLHTGTIANGFPVTPVGGPGHYSVCFSHGGSKLYACGGDVYQYDLSSGIPTTISGSGIKVGTPVGGIAGMKRAPDGKIYVSREFSIALNVIQFPDSPGLSCDYRNEWFSLASGTTTRLGLPNANVPPVTRTHSLRSFPVITDCFTDADRYWLYAADTTGRDYIWDDGSNNPFREIAGEGTYWVRYQAKGNCSFYTDTFQVTFQTTKPLSWGAYPSCSDKGNGSAWVMPATADTNSYTYIWRDAAGSVLSGSDTIKDIPSGDYTVQIISATGCDTTIQINVPEYTVSFTGDTLICVGEELDFDNTSDPHFQTFTWLLGDGTMSQSTQVSHQYSKAGTYRVQLIGAGAVCRDTAYLVVNADDSARITILSEEDSICVGQEIALVGQIVQDSTATTIQWDLGDGTQISDMRQVSHQYSNAGTISVLVTAQLRACPEITAQHTFNVFALPEIDLGNDTTICPGSMPITLYNRIVNPDPYRYKWSTGAMTQQITVDRPGTYILTAISGKNCVAEGQIEVRKDCFLDIPNAFSPDGDGINDYFFPGSHFSGSVRDFRIMIFNRWGQKLYESTSLNDPGWDGSWKGAPQPAGVYIYQIEVSFNNGTTELRNGNVTLIR